MNKKDLLSKLIRAARGQSPAAGANANSSTKVSLASSPRCCPPLPCFPLMQHHFGKIIDSNVNSDSGVATPSDFHSHICNKIRHARERVILASLYVGVGSKKGVTFEAASSTNGAQNTCKEDDLLEALHTASNRKLKQIQVLLDANRATRKVTLTNNQKPEQTTRSVSNTDKKIVTTSANAVFSSLEPHFTTSGSSSDNGVFLFPVNDQRLSTILPSPLDEVAGVFHIKAYIIDDELILSGANLSEEYFTNRVDRYMSFVHGGGGLVDFYAELCNILSSYAIKYDGQLQNETTLKTFFASKDDENRKQRLRSSLATLFERQKQNVANEFEESNIGHPSHVVAHAIPTFQMPNNFFPEQPLPFLSDEEVTKALIRSAVDNEQPASVRLSSAYLNLTPSMLSVLTMNWKKKLPPSDLNIIDRSDCAEDFGGPYILTAGLSSHGFAPKAGSNKKKDSGVVDKIKASIPVAFLALMKETALYILACGGKVLMFERPGWTFHAKGIWITAGGNGCNTFCRSRPELIYDPSSLVSTTIGSSNYGARSYDLDVESNCILVFNDSSDKNGENEIVGSMKKSVPAEWNDMCRSCSELKEIDTKDDVGIVKNILLQFMKRFL